MQTENRAPLQQRGSAVGLLFIGAVLVLLFTSGTIGLVTTAVGERPSSPAPTTSQGPPATSAALAAALDTRGQLFQRFRELEQLRERALVEADPALLDEVYAPGAPARTSDQREIDSLRNAGWRWHQLEIGVETFNAYQSGADRWTVIAAVSRSSAELRDAATGELLREEEPSRVIYRATMVRLDGDHWLIYRLTR